MSFNGSGVYTPPGASFPAVASTLIESAKYNAVINDMATALSTCITKDGQTTVTGNLPMATYRHTGVGDAAALTDYASANQVVDNALTYAGASAAGTDAYSVTLTVSPGAYAIGQRYQFLTDVANTGACTVDFNSIGATSIKLADGNDPHDGAIQANSVVDVAYDGTNFILLNTWLAIGTDVQAYDAGLLSIAGLTTAADKMIYTTASDTYAVADLTSYGRSLVATASEAAFKTLTNLEIGTDVQAYDADLASIAALSNTDGNFIVGNGSGWSAESLETARTSLGVQTKFKSADEALTADASYQDDDHLTGFPLTAGKWYSVRVVLAIDNTSTGYFKFRFILSETANDSGWIHWRCDDNANSSYVEYGTSITSVQTASGVLQDGGVVIEGAFQANSTTGGTIKLQWAQGSATGTTTSQVGGNMTVTQLD